MRMLRKHTTPGKNPAADSHGIETLEGTGEYEGHILFGLVSHDDIQVTIDVFMPDLLGLKLPANERRGHFLRYLGNMERDIIAGFENRRAKRLDIDSPIIILPESRRKPLPGIVENVRPSSAKHESRIIH